MCCSPSTPTLYRKHGIWNKNFPEFIFCSSRLFQTFHFCSKRKTKFGVFHHFPPRIGTKANHTKNALVPIAKCAFFENLIPFSLPLLPIGYPDLGCSWFRQSCGCAQSSVQRLAVSVVRRWARASRTNRFHNWFLGSGAIAGRFPKHAQSQV